MISLFLYESLKKEDICFITLINKSKEIISDCYSRLDRMEEDEKERIIENIQEIYDLFSSIKDADEQSRKYNIATIIITLHVIRNYGKGGRPLTASTFDSSMGKSLVRAFSFGESFFLEPRGTRAGLRGAVRMFDEAERDYTIRDTLNGVFRNKGIRGNDLTNIIASYV